MEIFKTDLSDMARDISGKIAAYSHMPNSVIILERTRVIFTLITQTRVKIFANYPRLDNRSSNYPRDMGKFDKSKPYNSLPALPPKEDVQTMKILQRT